MLFPMLPIHSLTTTSMIFGIIMCKYKIKALKIMFWTLYILAVLLAECCCCCMYLCRKMFIVISISPNLTRANAKAYFSLHSIWLSYSWKLIHYNIYVYLSLFFVGKKSVLFHQTNSQIKNQFVLGNSVENKDYLEVYC